MPQTKVRVRTSRPPLWPGLNRRSDLVQVTPGLARERIGEGRPLDAEVGGHGRLGLAGVHSTSSLDHDGLGQDGVIVGLSSLSVAFSSSSAPGGFVCAVCRGVSTVEMRRVATRRVVTVMTDHHRRVAEDQPEGDAVCSGDLVLPGGRIDPAELPVSPLHMGRAVPLPTLALKSSVHLGPEAVFKPEPCLGVHRETVPLRHVVRPRKEGEVVHAAD